MSRVPAARLGLCAWLASGCAADLLPGELVVPGELGATSWRGEPGSSLGAAVALGDSALLAGAPTASQVVELVGGRRIEGVPQLGRWVWWHDGAAFAAREDGVYSVDGDTAELHFLTPGAVTFTSGELHGSFVVATATDDGVQVWDDGGSLLARLTHPGVQQLAIGQERVLLLICADEVCEASSWDTQTDQREVLGSAGRGGAIIEVEGVAWWGDPQLDLPTAPGVVHSERGDLLEGLEGDHLGRRLCATHAAGIFNTWIVPARLRLVPLVDGPVLAIDRGEPTRPPALHSDGRRLAIGLPRDGVHEWGEGRVLLLELD